MRILPSRANYQSLRSLQRADYHCTNRLRKGQKMVYPDRPTKAGFLETADFYYQYHDRLTGGKIYRPDPCTGAYRYMSDFWREESGGALGRTMGLSEIAMLAEFHALSGL